ncbi:MAG: adenosine kinase [Halobacteriovoraceae bacterium]|nr:adenosine kinase [Halobacteriovoraceae bacterium]
MKQYDIYGIGNALVDMEFQVNEDFLRQMGIEKGVMTLVDQKRQDLLLNMLKNQKNRRSCGGSAANTVIGLVQLGGRGYYSCKVAADETGDFFYQDLLDKGVQNNLGKKRPDGVTGKCMVFITPDADRTMNTHLGITETFSMDELVEEELKKARYLYIEGYLAASPSAKNAAVKACKMAKKHNVKTALTLSDPSMAKFFKEGLLEMMDSRIDLLFCNEEEALVFSDTGKIEQAAKKLQELAEIVVITLGAKGACLNNHGELRFTPGVKVKAVDTNGAGDLFAGSFLYGMAYNYGFEKSAKLACATSSRLVTQYGPRLQPEQTMAVKKEVLSAGV